MFANLKPQPEDKILALMQAYRDDPRPEKIDLGVGVYKNAQGVTPVMRAVKSAERQLWEEQQSKSYVGLLGDPSFTESMTTLILDNAVPVEQRTAAATPGGTGAVRQAFEMIRYGNPKARIFVSDPTWPNHLSILSYLGMETVTYRYFDPATGGVDAEGMLADLAQARPGDVILLHGCCHNPTGANLTMPQWQEVIAVMQKTGALPMIDLAYQGFGDGLEEDAAATRAIASALPECLIAASCSKNFGLYRERAGLLIAVSQDSSLTGLARDTLAFLNRQNYSFPPDHGARVVSMILNDPERRADWASELEDTRLSMLNLRQQLAKELQTLSGSDRFAFLGQHRGMFSRLGTTPDKVAELRERFGIYMVGDSRMNIAGLNTTTVPLLAKAIIETGI